METIKTHLELNLKWVCFSNLISQKENPLVDS